LAINAGSGNDWLVGGGEMGDLVRAFDWSRTALGPIGLWPQSLRTAVSLCLSSTFPMNIIWGPESIQIYNDGYRVCCGDAHPRALGEDYRVTWASAWPAIGDSFDRAWAGERKFLENQRMFLKRLGGRLEETFFTFSHSPIQDEGGRIGGLFHPVTETTATMLAERRTRALRDLAGSLARARDETEVAERTVEILARFEFDLPFLQYYVRDSNANQYVLVGHHGIAVGTAQTPWTVAPDCSEPWPFAKALASSSIIELDDLSSSIFKEVRCGPYEEPPNQGFVIPIVVPAAEQAPAVILTGASSRLPMNADYRSFYDLLGVTIAGALSAVRAREDERRRAEALAEIDRAKTTFFSNVSHELRTPLTLMLGPLEELKRDLGRADASESGQYQQVELAHRNGLRLLKLVNTLLDFSRIEAGRVQAVYEPTDLAGATTELASVFRSAIEKAGLRLIVDCMPLSETAYVDREMWEKIVLNLLSNALKFTFDGEIEVSLREASAYFVLAVRDTGTGIPAHELPKLFERFHRVSGARGRSYEGSGIGLALVHELIKLHGGTISAESKLGIGTTFTVAIPRGRNHLPAEQIGASRILASTALGASHFIEEALRWLPETSAQDDAIVPDMVVPQSLSPVSGETAHILFADDNADMRDYVRRLLTSRYHVEVVPDGEAALAAIMRRKPDLLLADIMMPRLDGIQLLARLRAAPQTSTLPVILLSARAGEESRVEGMQSGADDYLVKPFSARELLARVEAHVKMARLRNEAAETLRTSEERFRAFVTASSDVVYRMSPDWTEMRYLKGKDFVADTESPTRGWLQTYVHPDDQARVMEAIQQAISAKSVFELEHPVIRVDGATGWAYSRAIPVLGEDGEIVEWFGAARDITERREWENRQRVLVGELQHRTRNLLAVVRSMTDKTIARSTDFADFRARYVDRLAALARVQNLLSRLAEGERITFDDLIGNELAALEGNVEKITLRGPRGVRLRSSTVQTFALALHELATNAVKYGAFSQPQGRLEIRWHLHHVSDDQPWLNVDWRERGVAMQDKKAPSQGGGAGRDLIERALPYQLGAKTTYEMKADGVHCTISLPVSAQNVFGDEAHV
jgi:signal transduction histidine kinase